MRAKLVANDVQRSRLQQLKRDGVHHEAAKGLMIDDAETVQQITRHAEKRGISRRMVVVLALRAERQRLMEGT